MRLFWPEITGLFFRPSPNLACPAKCSGIVQVFQMFHRYVASVSDGCCKSTSRCCICCNSCTRILKGLLPMFHLCFRTYVASMFIWMLHIFHTYVACVSSRCCGCLQRFQVLSGVFFQVFQKHVASVCFKCFTRFRHMLQVFYLNIAYVVVAIHMLQAYVSFVLDICCCKFSILQVFYEAQAVSPSGRRALGAQQGEQTWGRSRARASNNRASSREGMHAPMRVRWRVPEGARGRQPPHMALASPLLRA
jgi:hypothetical protein